MKKKLLIGAILILLVSGAFVIALQWNSEKQQKEFLVHYSRKNVTFLKFVSSENCMYSLDSTEVRELKSMGVNGIRICPLYGLNPDGTLREDIPESMIVSLIRKAHTEGLAVFLEINAGGKPDNEGMPQYRYSSQKHINELYETALHWAEIGEREKVEFYSPLNEPNLMFVNNNLAKDWINRSKNLKNMFSGNLVLKLADIGPEDIGNISGYDYIAFDIMWGDSDYQKLREHLRRALEKADTLKREYSMKGFFFGELGAERSRVTKNVQAEIFKTILEETWKNVEGYCFLGWSSLEFRFRDNEKAKNVIREWYFKEI